MPVVLPPAIQRHTLAAASQKKGTCGRLNLTPDKSLRAEKNRTRPDM
jgi:hypothetical protein